MTSFNIDLLKNDEYRQAHLLEGYENWTDEQKASLQKDLDLTESSYPGGVLNYIQRARVFLEASAKGENPFEGCQPLVPLTQKLEPGTEAFDALEQKGLDAIQGMAFVLVAGGLGERLGYDGIKVALPTECTTNTTYLQLYCEYILAFQAVAARAAPCVCPLAIMTSDDTYARTVALLKENNYFGLDANQVTIMKQEKVPALIDSDAKIANHEDSKALQMKPHGHGDVHQLLIKHDLPKMWLAEGKTHMVFFQDTNGLVFRALPATLGFSLEHKLAMNTICIARKAGEAVGAICKLVNDEKKTDVTINVEYNQLGPLLVAAGKGGDVADPATGNSAYPGNTNALLFDLCRYQSVMEETGGNIPEFVNPKYADETKTTFKSPTRLECMMQEYPGLLKPSDTVGCVEAPRFLCFSTVKNHYTDAAVKADAGGVPESAFTGEADIYASNVALLKLAAESKNCKVDIGAPEVSEWLGVKYPLGPRVVLKPSFGVCLREMKRNITEGSTLKLSSDSTLVLSGNASLDGLTLDGTLEVSEGCVNNVELSNEKCKMVPTTEEDELPFKIRGYKIEKPAAL